ncbi:MAG: hypothetical protein Q8R88_01375, partial [Desulfoprunum sp.]|nr:hypothetical protein [Desulfoprunum sp.]
RKTQSDFDSDSDFDPDRFNDSELNSYSSVNFVGCAETGLSSRLLFPWRTGGLGLQKVFFKAKGLVISF